MRKIIANMEVVKMKKKNFVSMIMGAAGGILFALGMCMCLLPEWNAFRQGVVIGAIGAAVLLAMLALRRRMEGKPVVKLSRRTVGIAALGVSGALVLGVGMCMTMVWDGLMIQGIVVGLAGIVLLLCLIPACRGLEK